jgi:hypothetical protein
MSQATEPAAGERFVVTVLEHNDSEGAALDVAMMGPNRWQLLTVDQTRALANALLDAADLAEECSEESDVPLRV